MRCPRGLLAGFAAAVMVAGCTQSGAPPSPTAAATVAAAATSPAPSAPLKIGVLLPYTESAIDSDIGASQKRAADLYVKLHGGKLGGRDVTFVWNDESALDPGINTVRIKQFLEQDHVDVLMGGAGAAAAYQLRDTAESSKIVYIDTNATANALTRAVPGCTPTCKSAYVFRSSATSWQLSEPLGEWAAKAGHKDFYLAYADDAFGSEAAAAFADGLAKGGGTATGREAVAEKSGDWAKVIAAIKAQPSKSVFAAFFTQDAAAFITAWNAAKLGDAGYRLYGPGPLADSEVIKDTKQASIGVVTSFIWSPDAPGAENVAFVGEFRKAYTDEDTGQPLTPDGYAFEMWNAVSALDQALASTHGAPSDAAALIAALEAVSFRGPGGPFSFDRATHDPTEDIFIREVRQSGGTVASVTVDRIAAVRDPGQ